MSGDEGGQRVLLGRIVGVHGLKGEVVVHSYTEVAEDIAAYGPLCDATGAKRLSLRVLRLTEKGVVVHIAGVEDRTAAEALKGMELWVERDRLPAAGADEFYHVDLVGLAAVSPTGEAIGTVVAVQNFGAGDLLEVRLQGSRRTEFVPFTAAFVPEVDIDGGRVVVDMPGNSPGNSPGSSEADEGGG